MLKQASFGYKCAGSPVGGIYGIWIHTLFFGAFIQAKFFLCRMSLLIYSLLDVCVMCCRGTPSPGSHVRVWRRRMTLRRDLGGRLEDSLTGNLWPASAQSRWRLTTERFKKAQTSSALIFAFLHRHATVIKKRIAAFVICSIFPESSRRTAGMLSLLT